MISLKRILFPTDLSENAKVAEAYACAFAEQFGAELHVLSVVQDMTILPPDPASSFVLPASNMDEVRASVEKALVSIPDAAWAAGKSLVRAVRTGTPFVEIIRYARENDIDLIVMGTHGFTGLVHALLGSVAEKVVRKAPCPVLTVRPKDHKFEMP